jgi:hypothetical protein
MHLWPACVEGNDMFDTFVAACVQRHWGIAQQCFSILSSSLSSRMITPHFPLIVMPPALGRGPEYCLGQVPLPWNSWRGPHLPSAHLKNLLRALRPPPTQQEAGVSTTIRYAVDTRWTLAKKNLLAHVLTMPYWHL